MRSAPRTGALTWPNHGVDLNAGSKDGGVLDLSKVKIWMLHSLVILLAISGSDLLIIVI